MRFGMNNMRTGFEETWNIERKITKMRRKQISFMSKRRENKDNIKIKVTLDEEFTTAMSYGSQWANF